MNKATIQQLIVCDNATRGDGKDMTSVCRGITQVFTGDGELIAIRDPYTWTIEEIVQAMAKIKHDNFPETGDSVITIVDKHFKR